MKKLHQVGFDGRVSMLPEKRFTISCLTNANLNIAGEYLARMHFRKMDRPSYVMDAEAGGAETRELPGRGRP